MTRLILIRHGVTEWNKKKRYCGRKDIGLSREGRAQAERLGARLKAVKFDKVYCSHRRRALQTGRIVFGPIKIIKTGALREVDFGVLEGLCHDEIMGKYACIYRKWIRNPFKTKIPGAEPMKVFKRRVKKAIQNIAGSNPGKTVAVVCHGGVIGIFVRGMLKNKSFWRCVPSPASVTTVEYKRGRPRLKKFNDTAHLEVNNE